MHVQVILVDEAENNLILSEREAWVSTQICLFPWLLPHLNSQCWSLPFVFSFLSFEIPAL